MSSIFSSLPLWRPSGANPALPLHFGLFLDRERWSEIALASECKWRRSVPKSNKEMPYGPVYKERAKEL